MRRVPGRNSSVAGSLAILIALLATSCGSTEGLTPVAYPDPSGVCPAGRTGWKLEVLDRRAERTGSEGVIALIGDSIRKSFPGCRWDAEAGEGAGTVRIELHRFATIPAGDTWDAAAEWTVSALDAAGATLTEFDANEEVSRPNYRGSNNAKESLREAFDRSLRRTLTGLRVVTSAGGHRPRGWTGPGRTWIGFSGTATVSHWARMASNRHSFGPARAPMERFSQPVRPEALCERHLERSL